MSGYLIHVEGVDFSGKTSLVAWLTAELFNRGIDAIGVREPGGTKLGEELRALIPLSQSRSAKFFMFRAASAQLHDMVVLPHLERGGVVVSDRGFLSSLAYNSYMGAGNLRPTFVVEAHRSATNDRMPELTLLLMAHPDALKSRRHSDEQGQDDLGYDGLGEKVYEGYQRCLMSGYGDTIHAIDAGGTEDFVRTHALQVVLEKLKEAKIYG